MDFSFISDIFFPQACLVCGTTRENSACCTSCFATIPLNTGLFTSHLFGAATNYDNHAVKTLIYKVKFDGMRSAAQPLGNLLTHYARRVFQPVDIDACVVIPIPLSKKRERWRGYNQATLIGNQFARDMGLPLQCDILARVRHTDPQSETANAAERRRNVEHCFTANCPVPASIILIDDVVTTGATLREAMLTLRAAGGKKIIALAVARALPPR